MRNRHRGKLGNSDVQAVSGADTVLETKHYKRPTRRIGLLPLKQTCFNETANGIGSEAISMTANGIGSEADSLTANGIRSANGIESDTIASVHMAIDQVAVSLKTDASAGVGSTRHENKTSIAGDIRAPSSELSVGKIQAVG